MRAEREDTWRLILNAQGRREVVTARVLVNAAGPGPASSRNRAPARRRRAVAARQGQPHRGAQAVRPDRGYIFQNSDKRIVFALPFAEDFTLIGTTDEPFVGDLDAVAPSADEVIYLCRAVNRILPQPVEPQQVVWAFAGVRSLYDDGHGKREDVTREYHLTLDERYRVAPLLTVYGGKITTYRRLAEDALGKLAHLFQLHRGFTATTPLPGGDFRWNAIEDRVAQTRQAWPFLAEAEAWRLYAPMARGSSASSPAPSGARTSRRFSARSARPRCAT